MELNEVRKALEELVQRGASGSGSRTSSRSHRSSNSKKDKKGSDRDRKKGKASKKKSKSSKKKKQRFMGGSSSSSSSSSRSGSSSSSGSDRFIRWQAKRPLVKFSDDQLGRMNRLRFKRRSDLQNFAQKYPGALGAHLLLQIREKLHGGELRRSEDLYTTDPTTWAAREDSIKDTRDRKELMFLTSLLLHLNKMKLERVVDLVAMRIRELRYAKSSGGSWEKAEPISLAPSGLPSTTAVPDAAFAL